MKPTSNIIESEPGYRTKAEGNPFHKIIPESVLTLGKYMEIQMQKEFRKECFHYHTYNCQAHNNNNNNNNESYESQTPSHL